MTDRDASAEPDRSATDGASAIELARRCDNSGRWGADDQRGTLNHITPDVVVAAAGLVRLGVTVSLAKPVATRPGPTNPRPAWHVMHLETERPYATADSIHLQIHGLANTHLDALGHMFLDGVGYNGRRAADVVDMAGLRALDVAALRAGIVTRGVLLDVAAATGRPWLEPTAPVTQADLEAAEDLAGTRVRAGDAVFVHVGLEARERVQGDEDPSVRAGLTLDAVAWLHARSVAVYSGDCIEQFPDSPGAVPMPLHQLGIARMGLVLLDCPSMTELVATCHRLQRWEFLLTVAPLVIEGGTGSPVNPLAVF
ncbi:cyclase family protein [Nakamurella endophytica]|uniref:Cyclase n=1 Tax=Nakamurella endophytica TaxID=1748367 RepID=A0A917WN00_9ACTN|nr:cyclase family protein [Nakamurella endophytica]GGM17551.1 cyclase [Nakamurella endophytica]